MTIEISTRQTGKTTRLIEALGTYLINNPDHVVNLVTCKDITGKLIVKHLISAFPSLKKEIEFKQRLNVSNKMLSQTAYPTWNNSFVNNKRVFDYYFVDEFEWIPEDNLLVKDNGYYCSSLRDGAPSKFLFKLFQAQTEYDSWENTCKRRGI